MFRNRRKSRAWGSEIPIRIAVRPKTKSGFCVTRANLALRENGIFLMKSLKRNACSATIKRDVHHGRAGIMWVRRKGVWPMEREERTAQFSPFAALRGYEAAIMEASRPMDGKAELS